MTEKRFCELYTQFHGEVISNVNQLEFAAFKGEELHEFVEFCADQEKIAFAIEQLNELRTTLKDQDVFLTFKVLDKIAELEKQLK